MVAPATVRTGVGEQLHLTLRGGTDVVVMSESALVLDDNDNPSVSAGEVQFQVPKQAPGHTFAVTARDYRVVVVGTRFNVRVQRDLTAVRVSEGVVEIWTDHRIARVAAGESWSAAVPPPAEATAPAAAAVREPSGNAMRAGIKVTRPARGNSAASVVTPAAQAAREARPLLALATPSKGPAAAGPVPAASGSNHPAPAAVAAGANNETTAAAAVPPALAPTPVETPLAVQAREARAAGDARRALGLYRTLAQRGGAAGENAEYEIGRILRDNLNQPHEALTAWRSYRTAHPRGLLRVEADISVIETMMAVGDKSDALSG